MSGRKSKVVKSVEAPQKFASRYVSGVFDNLIAQKLKLCKYPKATKKWLGKLRSSVLQKVSHNSKVLFQTEATNATELKASFRVLLQKIQRQREDIRDALAEQREVTTEALNQRIQSHNPAYEAGQFEQSAGRIHQQFSEVANLLSTVTPTIENSTNSFENNLKAVKGQLKPVLDAMLQRRAAPAPATFPTTSSTRTSGSAAKKTTTSTTNKDALQQLHKHLGKK